MSDVYLRAAVGGEQYALPVDSVLEVAPLGELTPVFGAPAAVLGLRNIRGRLVPVVDLAALMGVETGRAPARIVVVDHLGDPAALAVDTIVDAGPLPADGRRPASGLLAEAALADGELVGILDTDAVLDSLGGTP